MWGSALLTIIVILTPKLARGGQRSLTEGKVDLLIKLACFVMKGKNFYILKSS